MTRRPIKSTLSLSCVIASAFLLFQGCESAEVDEASAAAASSSNGSSDGSSSGGTTTQTIDVDTGNTPSIHRTTGDFTILKISPESGYTYKWTLSNSNIGNISSTTGNDVTYTSTYIPPSGSLQQTITVTGTRSGSSVIFQGTSVITHQAN